MNKADGTTDWSKIFMGAAIAIVFVFQGVAQVRQNNHGQLINQLQDEAIDIETVNAHLDKRFKGMIGEMLKVQKDTYKLNTEWLQWQKDNAKSLTWKRENKWN